MATPKPKPPCRICDRKRRKNDDQLIALADRPIEDLATLFMVSPVEVIWHRDHCMPKSSRGATYNPKVDELSALERADHMYAQLQRVMDVTVQAAEKAGDDITTKNTSPVVEVADMLQRTIEFRSKLTGELPEKQSSGGNMQINAAGFVMLPNTHGKTPEQVQELIRDGMALPAAQESTT